MLNDIAEVFPHSVAALLAALTSALFAAPRTGPVAHA
jgi:hypothetical protein